MRSVTLLLLCTLLMVTGCGDIEIFGKRFKESAVEPINAAFTEEELGTPLDWQSLAEADKAFLTALSDRNVEDAKKALGNGARANIDFGHGFTALMLAAATGDKDLVAAVREAGAKETPEAEPYLAVLQFAADAQGPEYQAALNEISRLAKVQPTPMEQAGTYKFELPNKAAETFLDSHHSRLLDRGCYVFLHDQNFGMNDTPDTLWVLPTRDKYAVMAFTGIDGINYESSHDRPRIDSQGRWLVLPPSAYIPLRNATQSLLPLASFRNSSTIRGFDEALVKSAEESVEACPTATIGFRNKVDAEACHTTIWVEL